jgi:predicted HNH restriction endonuclease
MRVKLASVKPVAHCTNIHGEVIAKLMIAKRRLLHNRTSVPVRGVEDPLTHLKCFECGGERNERHRKDFLTKKERVREHGWRTELISIKSLNRSNQQLKRFEAKKERGTPVWVGLTSERRREGEYSD